MEANSQIKAMTEEYAESNQSNLANEYATKIKLTETMADKKRLEQELQKANDRADRKSTELTKTKEELDILKKNNKEDLFNQLKLTLMTKEQ